MESNICTFGVRATLRTELERVWKCFAKGKLYADVR